MLLFFFFNDTATTEIYTLSLHDALPISKDLEQEGARARILANRPDGGAHRGGGRRNPDQERVLLPDCAAHVAGELGGDTRLEQRFVEEAGALGGAPVVFADHHPLLRSRPADHPGAGGW